MTPEELEDLRTYLEKLQTEMDTDADSLDGVELSSTEIDWILEQIYFARRNQDDLEDDDN